MGLLPLCKPMLVMCIVFTIYNKEWEREEKKEGTEGEGDLKDSLCG